MKNKKNLIGYIKSYQSYLGWKLYLFLALTIFAALSEGIGIMMVLPLLQQLSVNDLDVQNPQFQSVWINDYIDPMLTQLEEGFGVILLLLIIAVAFLIKGLLNFVALSLNVIMATQLIVQMKRELLIACMRVEYSKYLNNESGRYISLINDQTFKSVEAFKHFSKVAAYFINAIIYVSFALSIAWKFGVMTMIAGCLIIVCFRLLNRKVRNASRQAVNAYNRKTGNLVDIFRSFAYLRVTGQLQKFSDRFSQNLNDYARYIIRTGIFSAITQSLREPLAVTLIILVVVVQIKFFGEAIAPILVAIVLFYRSINSVLGMQLNFQQAYGNVGSFEQVNDQIEFLKENPEQTHHLRSSQKSFIKFKNVSFAYSNKSKFSLKNINFEFSENDTIAIIGPSGSGKSTVIGLLTGLVQPSAGKIEYGYQIGDNSEYLRSNIGYVPQEISLFNASIWDNISMFAKRDNATLLEVKKAAEAANISSFIEELPDEYDSIIGENGVLMSGGQKQRIAIARELFRKPKILIFDEATSALDGESERLIQQSLSKLSGSLLLIIIAHRLNTVKKSKKIVLIENGEITEMSSASEYKMNSKSKIRKLFDSHGAEVE